MPLGDHGRRVLVPMTLLQKLALFPYRKLYNSSMYVRSSINTFAVLGVGWAYIFYKGYDVWFTPYDAVHHSISHKLAHDLEHWRYPPRHSEHDNKEKH